MANTHHIAAPLHRATAPMRSNPTPRSISAQLTHDPRMAKALWQRLEAEPTMTVHQGRGWVEAWAREMGTQLYLVTLEQEGIAFALLPLEISHRAGLRIAQFAGTAFSNENTGLTDPALLDGIAPLSPDTLAAALTRAGLDADIVLFDKMPPEAAARPPFSELPRVEHQNPSFQLPLCTDFNAVLAQINGKRRRKKFRVSERRLEAIGGYRHITGQDDDAQALRLLDVFLTQKRIRLASQGLPNVFAGRNIRAFLAKLATMRDKNDRPALELHGIELVGGDHAGRIIAVAGLTHKAGHVTCQFGSIDEEVATDASAGELLFYRMIERAAAAGDTVFDFGVGDQPYKRSWCPRETRLVDCYVPLTFKGRLAAPLIAGLIRLKRTIKSSPTLHRAAARLRSFTVRKTASGAARDDS